MKIIAAIDNLIFLLLVAMAGLLRLLASKAGSSGKRLSDDKNKQLFPRQQAQPPAREPTPSDEEQIRKFLEALGQPTTSKPPPPVVPRHDLPPRPVAPVQPPGPPSQLRRIKQQASRREEEPSVAKRRTIIPQTPPPLPEKYQEQPVSAAPSTPVLRRGASDLELLLKSPSGLRNAIILREIFGPPRSLQPLEDLAGSA